MILGPDLSLSNAFIDASSLGPQAARLPSLRITLLGGLQASRLRSQKSAHN